MAIDIPPEFTPSTTDLRDKWNALIESQGEAGANPQAMVDEFGARFHELLQLATEMEFKLRTYTGKIEPYEDEAGNRFFRETGNPDGPTMKIT